MVVKFDILKTSDASQYWVLTPTMLYNQLEQMVNTGWSLPRSVGNVTATCIYETAWVAESVEFSCSSFPCEIPSSAVVILPTSVSNQLYTLSKVKNDDSRMPVARSYNGGSWEVSVGPDDGGREGNGLNVICSVMSGTACSGETCSIAAIRRSAGNKLVIESFQRSSVSTTKEKTAARFLMQTTFGPTLTEIQSLATNPGTNIREWIEDQVNLAPTYHRVYYRERCNPRAPESTDASPGAARSACSIGSQWHSFAFDRRDIGRQVQVQHTGSGIYRFVVDGVSRTELSNQAVGSCTVGPCDESIQTLADLQFVNLTVFSVIEHLSGEFVLLSGGVNKTYLPSGNPSIAFQTPDVGRTLTFGLSDITTVPYPQKAGYSDIHILSELHVTCPELTAEGPTFMKYNGQYSRHVKRISLLENTRSNPAAITATSQQSCPAVARTFLHDGSAHKCKRQDSCSPMQFDSALLTLNSTTVRKFYELAGRFVYFIEGLNFGTGHLAKDPCQANIVSRWRKSIGACQTESTYSNADTRSIIINALNQSTDPNPVYRDIIIRVSNHETCASTSTNPVLGSSVTVGDSCWENVHPELDNVYDMSDWVLYHPGNYDAKENGRRNPIARWAEEGEVSLIFPHPMSNWMRKGSMSCCELIGRRHDVLDFKSLRTELQSLAFGSYIGAIGDRPTDGFQACGSPGEVQNQPTLGHRYGAWLGDKYTYDEKGTDDVFHAYVSHTWGKNTRDNGKIMVWTNVALKAADQLRQRICWALAQILVVSVTGSSRPLDDEVPLPLTRTLTLTPTTLTCTLENQVWHVYYDIFVRNAFGNFRDIMREVSFNPIMADYLSSLGNKAMGSYTGGVGFPDENYGE